MSVLFPFFLESNRFASLSVTPVGSESVLPWSPFPWVDMLLIALLVLLNGLFALSELAIISAREARLQAAERKGIHAARVARMLAADPGRFLSTVQIGITLIGIIAGAYSGASLGEPVAQRLRFLLGLEADTATTAGFVLVIVVTTYASLVIGELVPKQLALRASVPIAIATAVPMLWLSRIAAPLVWLLDKSSALIFHLLRLERESKDRVTAEELQLIVAEASKSGVIEEHERAIIAGVMRLADRPVREIMTPRTNVDWVDIGSDSAQLRALLLETPYSILPVARGSVDNIIGVVLLRDVAVAFFHNQERGESFSFESLIRHANMIHDQIDAMDALESLRCAEVPMLLVHDEYGHFEGLVTPSDLLSAIAFDQDVGTKPHVIERDNGSLLVAGAMPADALAERLGIRLADDRDYATVAGHALSVLRHLPKEGERFLDQGWLFEIVDMDGRKIDKLLVSVAPQSESDS